ncbi:MAG TPA: HAMP domain-containing sensor histidine kinase [Patescibacteria group bacterium]
MKKNSLIENKLCINLYNYSRKYRVSKWTENFILVLFSILVSVITTIGIFFIFKSLNKQSSWNLELPIQLIAFILSIIVVRILIGIVRRTNEVKELKKREKDYAQTFTQLHDEYVKALEEIKARDEFLSIASHELKTPLTSILLKLHNMINNVRNVSLVNFSVPELMRVLENAEQQIRSLSTMINDLLNISLITTGRMDLDLENLDLVAATKRVKENFSEVLERKHYLVKINAKSPVIGFWDRARIEQVITNLLSNAIKYGENKPIEIKIFISEGMGKFSIKDQGIGILPEKQKMLFNRFARVAPTDGEKKGLGVGLYITHQIVKAHNGRVKLFSVPKEGSTFTIELPIKKL